ncbi:hypothetical protein [Bifidobacterium sp.]|uniref:hypothetical protein n=1 Tax=Bifidobacterium sp. TaxID=41200 RepID=UPI0025B870DA|nr:hypothetical protein [Bifidobacterium sp.]MCH4209096.1 hypothetical protein [Bifidobacterium sp.]MCI1224723.1 hypothetical protein [Bifidobacterium sp.]
MSTNSHYGSDSIRPSREGFVASGTGSARPARPAQIDPGIVEGLSGGTDPQEIDEMSHVSAAALLDRVHHSEDPQIVQRVLGLVDAEGVDIIAGLWSHAQPDSLPGMLWRLYLLRTWMNRHRESVSQLWRIGEPVATSASAVAGVDQAPDAEDIARIADSILSGAFTGDFAVALERAAAFTDVAATGLRLEAQHVAHRNDSSTASSSTAGTVMPSETSPTADSDTAKLAASSGRQSARDPQTAAARLMHTAGNLTVTSRDFLHGASLWRQGRLE